MKPTFSILFFAFCLAAKAAPWEDIPERNAIYLPYAKGLDAASRSDNPVTSMMEMARTAESQHSARAPGAVARMLHTTGLALNWMRSTNAAAHEGYVDVVTRSRSYLPMLSLGDQLNLLTLSELPLASTFTSHVRGGLQQTELEAQLNTWREVVLELERVKDWPFEIVYASTQRDSFPRDAAGELAFQDERARNKSASERHNFVQMLRVDGARLTNQMIGRVSREYSRTPLMLGQLQETLDGYLPPEVSTPVMDKVFESMPRDVAAKTPRPVPGAKGERWIRPPAPIGEPGLPAIARPSKLRDSMGVRGGSGAVASETAGKSAAAVEAAGGGAGQSDGRPLWHWVGLGLAVVVAGGIWLRAR